MPRIKKKYKCDSCGEPVFIENIDLLFAPKGFEWVRHNNCDEDAVPVKRLRRRNNDRAERGALIKDS